MALAISAMLSAPANLLFSLWLVATTDAALTTDSESSSLDGFCQLCQSFANEAVFAVRLGLVTTKDATELVQNECQEKLDLPGDICPKAAAILTPYIFDLIKKSNYTGPQLCSVGLPNCQKFFPLPPKDWSVSLPPFPSNPAPKLVPQSYRPLNILHLTDIHIDGKYDPGSAVDCVPKTAHPLVQKLLICCRGEPAKNGSQAAGYWGSTLGMCDLPYRTFESALKFVRNSGMKFDYILLTGDFLPHDMWDYGRVRTLSYFRNVTRTVELWLPNTRIYLQLGNHEAVPFDAYSYEPTAQTPPQAWLYREMELFVEKYVPDLASRRELPKHGSYVAYPTPGLKIINLNNNFCFNLNFFARLSKTDPGGVLSFLSRELAAAEAAGQVVHIHAHIPPTTVDCLPDWNRAYLLILERYQSTVREQFHGHSHFERHLVYLDGEKKPIGSGWVAASMTTWDHVNPAFRTYTLDRGFRVASSSVFSASVDGLGPQDEPVWMEQKSQFPYLDATSRPTDWYRFISGLLQDNQKTYRQDYVQNIYRHSPWIQKAGNCDDRCAKELLKQNIVS